MDKEYNKHKTHTWDETKVKECDDVVKEAKAKGETFHVGRVFGIAGIKGHELPVGHPLRKYKGWCVSLSFKAIGEKTRTEPGPSSESLGHRLPPWKHHQSLWISSACCRATQSCSQMQKWHMFKPL
eukprot:6467726-Amphidinium_carterae.3